MDLECVAGVNRGRGRGNLGARSTLFSRAQNLLSFPFQTPVTQANIDYEACGKRDLTLSIRMYPPFRLEKRMRNTRQDCILCH